jgi:hypothetical protein
MQASARATLAGNESANETETSRPVRDTGRPSGNRTIRGAIKAFFRCAVKAITGQAEEAPKPSRRRRGSGDAEGVFQRAARIIARPFNAAKLRQRFKKRSTWLAGRRCRTIRLPPEAWGPADAHLTNTLDLQRLWNGDAAADFDSSANYDAQAERLSPRP